MCYLHYHSCLIFAVTTELEAVETVLLNTLWQSVSVCMMSWQGTEHTKQCKHFSSDVEIYCSNFGTFMTLNISAAEIWLGRDRSSSKIVLHTTISNSCSKLWPCWTPFQLQSFILHKHHSICLCCVFIADSKIKWHFAPAFPVGFWQFW